MSAVTLTLDGFVFQDFEIPEAMPFGGAQGLSIKRLIGGARDLHAMGADDRPMEWTGRFRGSEAVSRALQIDAKRRAGRAVSLTFGELSFQVLIARFEPVFDRAYEVPYYISCEVVPAATSTTATADVGVHQMVTLDNSSVQTLGAGIGDFPLTGMLETLNAAVLAVSDFAAASQAVIATVLTPIATVQARIAVLLGATDDTLLGSPALDGALPASGAAALAQTLLGQVLAMATSADLQELSSYAGRMATNLQAIGASGARVIMAGGDLFRVASDTYGDATEWASIARVNGLTDPLIEGVKSILVPPTPSKKDGVLDEVLGAAVADVDVSLPVFSGGGAGGGGGGALDFSDPDDSDLLPGL